jgi:hypothetical protein
VAEVIDAPSTFAAYHRIGGLGTEPKGYRQHQGMEANRISDSRRSRIIFLESPGPGTLESGWMKFQRAKLELFYPSRPLWIGTVRSRGTRITFQVDFVPVSARVEECEGPWLEVLVAQGWAASHDINYITFRGINLPARIMERLRGA